MLRHPGQRTTQERILALWDAGERDVRVIRERTGATRTLVSDVLRRMRGRDGLAERKRHAGAP